MTATAVPAAHEITCPHCSHSFPLSDALRGQIERHLIEDERRRHQTELEEVRAQATEKAAARAAEQYRLQLVESADASAEQKQTILELRDQHRALMKELRARDETIEQEQLAGERRRQADRAAIRLEEQQRAEEKNSLAVAEMREQLRQTEEALAMAQRKARQGSQQIQGEALELQLEEHLTRLFPHDDVAEVKKGQRGADVKQTVRTALGMTAGIILWEAKNAQWSPSWQAKLTIDMREAGADHAVLISAHMPESMGSLAHLGGTVWAATPAMAGALAAVLRESLVHTHEITTLNASADERVEALRRYITGPEFRHRMDAMLENFTAMQAEIEAEKRWFERKWARQEKALRGMVANVTGLQGDFDGVAGLTGPGEERVTMAIVSG